MSVTTKSGDDGKTSVMGKRVDKDSEVIEVIGSIDELMAVLGVAVKQMEDKKTRDDFLIDEIYKINHNLYLIMGMISGYGKDVDVKEMVKEIEEKSKKIEEEKGSIREFLEAGKQLDVWLNWGRTVARRVERKLVKYSKVDHNLDHNILIYINRLSDYLFNLGRLV